MKKTWSKKSRDTVPLNSLLRIRIRDSRYGFFLTRDLEWKNSDPVSGFRHKHPGSATLVWGRPCFSCATFCISEYSNSSLKKGLRIADEQCTSRKNHTNFTIRNEHIIFPVSNIAWYLNSLWHRATLCNRSQSSQHERNTHDTVEEISQTLCLLMGNWWF